MRKNFCLAYHFFYRDWRSRHWIIIFFALVLSIASLTTLKFYTSRVLLSLSESRTQFLGGDISLQSPTPIPNAWKQMADQLSLKSTQVWSYPTMVKADQKYLLVTLQAVDDHYPLVGLEMRPAINTMWIDPRIASYFAVKTGDTLQIGEVNFAVSQILTTTSAALNAEFLMTPRALINIKNVEETKTILPASRVNYQMQLTGSPTAISDFSNWVKPKLNSTQKLLNADSKQLRLETYFSNGERLLQLALTFCFFLNGIALFLSTRYYLLSHVPVIALIRSLGTTRKSIMQIYAWQFLFISLIAAAIGIIIGFICQQVFVALFKDYFTINLMWTFSPVLIGLCLSFSITIIFAYPLIADLSKISPLALWRQTLELANHTLFWSVCAGLCFFIISLSTHALLYLMILSVLTFSVGLLYFIAISLISLLKEFASISKGGVKQGIKQLYYYSDLSALQYIAFTLIAMLLLIFHGIGNDLVSHWRKTLPINAPNYFIFNLSASDLKLFIQLKNEHDVPVEGIYPMVRARLTQLNHQNIFNVIPESARTHNALHRELNISWMERLDNNNQITTGAPWSMINSAEPVVSVENELAHRLGLKIGDTLTITIADKNIDAKVVNFRKVAWDSFRPNFFLIFSPGVLQNFPTTYVTSFYLSPNHVDFINILTEKFPNASVIDVVGILNQLQLIISKIGQAAKYLMIFASAAGVLVFFACLQASSEDRKKTYDLMNVLGAGRRYRAMSLITEFSVLLLLSLGSALLLSYLFINIFEKQLFSLVS